MNINNNRREVGPLQASAMGPVQTAAPSVAIAGPSFGRAWLQSVAAHENGQ